jgi:hypothetical protein
MFLSTCGPYGEERQSCEHRVREEQLVDGLQRCEGCKGRQPEDCIDAPCQPLGIWRPWRCGVSGLRHGRHSTTGSTRPVQARRRQRRSQCSLRERRKKRRWLGLPRRGTWSEILLRKLHHAVLPDLSTNRAKPRKEPICCCNVAHREMSIGYPDKGLA